MNEDSDNCQNISLMDEVKKLSFPRRAGTDGEGKAREYIVEQLKKVETVSRDYGFSLHEHEFSFPTDSSRVAHGIFIAIFAALIFANFVLLLYMGPPLTYLSYLTSFLIVAVLCFSTRWSRFIEIIFSREEKEMTRTANIEAVIDREAEQTLVFMAHYDSKSQPVGMLPRLILAILCGGSAILIALYSALYQAWIGDYLQLMPADIQVKLQWINAVMVMLGFLIIATLSVFFILPASNESPGALDNATGTAVLLALVRHFAPNPPDGFNIRFLFTSAEEEGLIGSVRYMEKMESKLPQDKTFFINLDSVGGTGSLKIINRYGIPPLTSSRKISKILQNIAKQENIPAKEFYSPAGAGYDSLPPSIRGYEAVTLVCTGFDKALWDMHSQNDGMENIKGESMEKAFNLCRGAVEKWNG